jgi:hypothetical protein
MIPQETLASTDGFGKYGVIRENDMYRFVLPISGPG